MYEPSHQIEVPPHVGKRETDERTRLQFSVLPGGAEIINRLLPDFPTALTLTSLAADPLHIIAGLVASLGGKF